MFVKLHPLNLAGLDTYKIKYYICSEFKRVSHQISD